LVKKIVKIGPVDTEIALLIVKKIKKKKLTQAKYITFWAGLPGRLISSLCRMITSNADNRTKKLQ